MCYWRFAVKYFSYGPCFRFGSQACEVLFWKRVKKLLFYTLDRYVVLSYFISKIITNAEKLKADRKRPRSGNQGGILVPTTNIITKLVDNQKEKKKPKRKRDVNLSTLRHSFIEPYGLIC